MKEILEYQELDMELNKLNKLKDSFEEAKVMNKMIKVVKDAQNKSLQLETNSKDLIEEYYSLKKNYEEQAKSIQKLIKIDLEKLNKEDVSKYLTQINSISSELFMIERNLNIIITKINKALKDFEISRGYALKARNKHKEAKGTLYVKLSEVQPQIDAILDKLKKKEGKLNKELFNKYKTYKNDGLFPVFVKLEDKVCGFCRMELPSRKIDAIKTTDFIVCEQCRRIIYK